MKQLKVNYRIGEFNDRRMTRLIENLRVIQKAKQITYQPEPDYLMGHEGANCPSQAPSK